MAVNVNFCRSALPAGCRTVASLHCSARNMVNSPTLNLLYSALSLHPERLFIEKDIPVNVVPCPNFIHYVIHKISF